MKTHSLKTWPEYFEAILCGRKRFELRKNDRNYRVGDTLLLKEWDPNKKAFSGLWVRGVVTYILNSGEFMIAINSDYCIMSFRVEEVGQ